jgi:predicted amidohydrolase YtcJ
MNESGLYADTIYVNGIVVALDASGTRAEGVATFGGKIVAVGSYAQIQKMAGPRTKIVDLAGKTMVPGLIEPHNHFILYGPWALARVDISSPPVGKIRNLRELQEMLKGKAAQTARGQWVMGFGYDDTLDDIAAISVRHWLGSFCGCQSAASMARREASAPPGSEHDRG